MSVPELGIIPSELALLYNNIAIYEKAGCPLCHNGLDRIEIEVSVQWHRRMILND